MSLLVQSKGDRVHREVLGDHRRQSQESRLELGYVSAIDSQGRTIWITDAHRDDGKRYVVRADEKLTAFVELELGDLYCRTSTELRSA